VIRESAFCAATSLLPGGVAPGTQYIASDSVEQPWAFEEGGEFSAAIELRRRFPGINNNDQAREHARIIAGWQPIPATPQSHKAKNRKAP
jgi:hypothetical protein